jgi:hypothetical protein
MIIARYVRAPASKPPPDAWTVAGEIAATPTHRLFPTSVSVGGSAYGRLQEDQRREEDQRRADGSAFSLIAPPEPHVA